MTGLRTLGVVFRKELLDGSRDRRSVMTLVFSAAITPVLFGVLFTVTAERRKNAESITLPVAGVEYAPMFVAWLRQQTGVTIVPAPADAERAVRDRDEDVVLIVDQGFDTDMARAAERAAAHFNLLDGKLINADFVIARVRAAIEADPKLAMQNTPGPFMYLTFNTKQGPFTNAKLRQAVAFACKRDEIVKKAKQTLEEEIEEIA